MTLLKLVFEVKDEFFEKAGAFVSLAEQLGEGEIVVLLVFELGFDAQEIRCLDAAGIVQILADIIPQVPC